MNDSEDEMPSDPRAVLGADGAFAGTWLRERTVVPVPAGERIDTVLARRIVAGCRAVGVSYVLAAELVGAPGAATGARAHPLSAPERWTAVHPPVVLATPGLHGAVLFPEAGYALVAGTDAFVAATVGEGADAARARFGRHARALAERRPALSAVAAAHRPARRAWSRLDDVDPASAAARQVLLLRAFADGTCGAPDFAHGWWDSRRASQADGERIHGALGDLFDRVFMILEDYSVDPDLAEPGDLDDAGLLTSVRAAWEAFRPAFRPSGTDR